MPPTSTPLNAPDRAPVIAPECLLDALFGAALLAQGFTTEQAAEWVRRSQAQRGTSEHMAARVAEWRAITAGV